MKPDEHIEVRFILDVEQHLVVKLLIDNGYDFARTTPFNRLWPHWIGAYHKGTMVGCMQVLVGFPVSTMQLTSVDVKLNAHEQAMIWHVLTQTALDAIYDSGAEAVIGLVPFEKRGAKRMMKHHWDAQTITSGNILMTSMTRH